MMLCITLALNLRSLGLDSKLPPLQQWGHTTEPHPPLRSLETASSNISNSVKTVVETQGGLAIMGRRSKHVPDLLVSRGREIVKYMLEIEIMVQLVKVRRVLGRGELGLEQGSKSQFSRRRTG